MMSVLTVDITGGGSGIGAETVRVLALRGAHVVIGARNVEAANQVKKKIVKEYASARITVLKLDLSSLNSVENFVDEFNALGLPLNILMYKLLSSFLLHVFFVHSRLDLHRRGIKTGNTISSWSIPNTCNSCIRIVTHECIYNPYIGLKMLKFHIK